MIYLRPIILAVLFLSIFGYAARAQSDGLPATDSSRPILKDADNNRYKLNPGDVFEIIYRYTPEFNQTVTVQPDGFVTLRVVGELRVKDLSLPEIRKKIIDKARQRLKDPEITLLLKEFRTPFFVVAGEVLKPGRFEMAEDTTALQAVLLAGGFTTSAKSSQILVYRKISSKYAEVKLLNLKKLRKRENVLEDDLILESGDMLLVPRNRISKVERIVGLATVFRLFTPILP